MELEEVLQNIKKNLEHKPDSEKAMLVELLNEALDVIDWYVPNQANWLCVIEEFEKIVKKYEKNRT